MTLVEIQAATAAVAVATAKGQAMVVEEQATIAVQEAKAREGNGNLQRKYCKGQQTRVNTPCRASLANADSRVASRHIMGLPVLLPLLRTTVDGFVICWHKYCTHLLKIVVDTGS